MSLVQYSDYESDADQPAAPPAKRSRRGSSLAGATSKLPPLPAAFHDLYASSTRVSVKDDPSLHGGRKRVIPHVEGNWPTHVYLEWYPCRNELGWLEDLIGRVQKPEDSPHEQEAHACHLHSLLHSELGAQLPLHISLSPPVVLRTEQRASFTEALTNSIRASHVPQFTVIPDTLKWVSNHEHTRWFLVLHVAKPSGDELNRILHLSNRTLVAFDQPPLYAPSRGPLRKRAEARHNRKQRSSDSGPIEDYSNCFHISIAWSLTEPSGIEKERLANLDLGAVKDVKVKFDCVKIKIGNYVENVELATEVPGSPLR
ncbi:hypothetical protein POX_h09829 [Penicillium oxalicum]|uniref:hypothetical protein n=1 Tax=Penicillium oxalicum TaxID=69781 RepID=UPI0020B6A2B0|nr:hypothetical protein POX_h09829 [Penicillium oxalicum]KAI2786063.1 hypothetical protein POX_h09829 [Penicillium oxalicum]